MLCVSESLLALELPWSLWAPSACRDSKDQVARSRGRTVGRELHIVESHDEAPKIAGTGTGRRVGATRAAPSPLPTSMKLPRAVSRQYGRCARDVAERVSRRRPLSSTSSLTASIDLNNSNNRNNSDSNSGGGGGSEQLPRSAADVIAVNGWMRPLPDVFKMYPGQGPAGATEQRDRMREMLSKLGGRAGPTVGWCLMSSTQDHRFVCMILYAPHGCEVLSSGGTVHSCRSNAQHSCTQARVYFLSCLCCCTDEWIFACNQPSPTLPAAVCSPGHPGSRPKRRSRLYRIVLGRSFCVFMRGHQPVAGTYDAQPHTKQDASHLMHAPSAVGGDA